MRGEPVDTLAVGPAGTAPAVDFDDFYRAQFPRLVPLARALCGPVVADDIAQEAMLAAYRKWALVSELAVPEAWVRRTCANLAVSAFRRRVSEIKAVLRLRHDVPHTPLDNDDEAFWAAVRSLPKRQAQSAALRYLYDMPVAEIAETLDISTGSVKQHLSRARAALVQALGLEQDADLAIAAEEDR